jgi:hypothetical protein
MQKLRGGTPKVHIVLLHGSFGIRLTLFYSLFRCISRGIIGNTASTMV